MKKLYLLLMCCALCAGTAGAQKREMKLFENLAVSLNAGTLGGGIEVATPINSYLTVRGGFSMLPLKYTYDYSDFDFDELQDWGIDDINYTVPLKAKLNMYHGKLLADFYPLRRGAISITGGFMFGTSKLLTVSGTSEAPITIGDITIEPGEYGKVEAWVKTNAVKPYVGLGFGHAIPKGRVGFRCDMGAMFQGKTKIQTNNPDFEAAVDQEDLNDLNKAIDMLSVYPYLNLQLSVRLF